MNRTREAYKTKLAAFNSTAKYKTEVDFLMRLMSPIPGEKILDFGCGRGHLVWDLVDNGIDAYGFDFINYRERDDLFRFRMEYGFKFDKVFMMHSIAHLPDVEAKLAALREGMNPGGKIYVITPNPSWMRLKQGVSYEPDPTVIKHFEISELKQLFLYSGFQISVYGQIGDHCYDTNERLFLEATI